MKTTLLLLLALALTGGCDRTPVEPAKPMPPPPNVQVIHAHRGAITRSAAFPGNVLAYQAVTLYAKLPGYLKGITVDKGDAVKTGDVLAEIEDPELLAEVAKYQSDIDVAELNFKRVNEARQKAPDLVVPAAVDEAKAKVDIARANLKRINELLGYSKLSAPFAGIITRRFVDLGAFIPAATANSAASAAAIVTLMDFSKVRVDVAVPEPEVPFVVAGLPATVLVEELAGQIYTGTVTRFEYALDQATKTMMTEIEIENPERKLRPGMYATVRLGLQHKPDALLLPADAVLVEKIKTSVFTIAEGKAKKTPVKTGFDDGTNVEIIEGITENQPVIRIGKQTIADGQSVTTVEAK